MGEKTEDLLIVSKNPRFFLQHHLLSHSKLTKGIEASQLSYRTFSFFQRYHIHSYIQQISPKCFLCMRQWIKMQRNMWQLSHLLKTDFIRWLQLPAILRQTKQRQQCRQGTCTFFPQKTFLNFALNSKASITLKHAVTKQKLTICMWSQKTSELKNPAEYWLSSFFRRVEVPPATNISNHRLLGDHSGLIHTIRLDTGKPGCRTAVQAARYTQLLHDSAKAQVCIYTFHMQWVVCCPR